MPWENWLLSVHTPGAAEGVSGLFCSPEWGPKIGEEGRRTWKLFISLLRVVLENVYLVPSGSPHLVHLTSAVGEPLVQTEGKSSRLKHSQSPLLPCELEEIE